MIRLHSEIRFRDLWQHYGCPFIPENTFLLRKMGFGTAILDIAPLAVTKIPGPPNDATEITRRDHITAEVNEICVMQWDEVKELRIWLGSELFDKMFGMKNLPHGFLDLRLIYWLK